MDQAQPTTPQTAPAPQAAATSAPPPSVQQPAGPHPNKSSHKGLVIFIGIVLLLTFLGGAAYLLLHNESATQISETHIQQATTEYVEPSPTVVQLEGTVEEVEAITIDETNDTSEIQMDLDQL